MDVRLFAPFATSILGDVDDGKALFPLLSRWCAVLIVSAVVLAPAFLTTARAAEPGTRQREGGTLIIAGGGPLPNVIRDHFMQLAGGKNARLVVIPTASKKADQPRFLESYQFFNCQDVRSVDLLHTRDRKRANEREFVRPLTRATGVWLTGGDQTRLTEAYHGTAVEKELQGVVARGGVIGGTSAGAAVMSSLMIVGGTVEAEVGTGFGLLDGVVIDQHFHNRNRLRRLLGVLAKHPQFPGVGIDEETALVVHGNTATVEGRGNVRACLCGRGPLPPLVQVLKDGEKLDIDALMQAALTRVKSAVETKHPSATTERTPGEPKPSGRKGGAEPPRRAAL